VGNEGKRLWPDIKYSADICIEEIRKITKTCNDDSQSSDRNSNPRPPDYETGVRTTRLQDSVLKFRNSEYEYSGIFWLVFGKIGAEDIEFVEKGK
jgi:hypothetical protein